MSDTPPQPTATTQLNDCKKCGSYAVPHVQRALPIPGAKDEHLVCCSCCTQKSEWKPTAFEAAQDWNRKNKARP